jgi:hypothetical protein
MHPKSIALFLAAVPWLPSPSLAAQGVRVHPPLPAPTSDVSTDFYFALDERRVYSHDRRFFSAIAGNASSVVALDAGLPPAQLIADVAFSGDRRTVVWSARASSDLPFHTYAAPFDGATPALQISSRPVGWAILRVFPDWVLTSLREGPAVVDGLLRVHLDGSPTRTLTTRPIWEVQTTAAGDWVVLRTQAAQDKLFSVPTEAGAEVALYEPPPGEALQDFEITLDGAYVIYLTGPSGHLLRVPIDGSRPAVLLSDASHDATTFELTPDGLGVVYVASTGSLPPWELFGVPIDRSGPPVRLSAIPASSSWSHSSYGVSNGAPHLIHISGGQLHSTAIGSGMTVLLNGPLTEGSVDRYLHSPDGEWVVFHVNNNSLPDTLHSVPTDGSRPAVSLYAGGEDVLADDYTVTPTGYALFLTESSSGSVELHSAPLDGSRPAMPLHAPLGTGSVRSDYAVTGHGYAVFRASQEATSAIELFAARVDGRGLARRISSPMGIGGNVDIPYAEEGSFQVSPDGWSVLYRADQKRDDMFQLYETWIDREPPVRAAGPP